MDNSDVTWGFEPSEALRQGRDPYVCWALECFHDGGRPHNAWKTSTSWSSGPRLRRL